MIEIPEELKRAAENFRNKLLREEKVIIYHDTDPDGIVSGALLEDLLRKHGIKVEAYAKDRKDVHFKEGDVYVLADIRIDEKILEEAQKKDTKIYYVDHHEPVGLTKETVVLNPWFIRNLPVNPYRYNTALLVWLIRHMPKEDEWKVAAAHWADYAEDKHTEIWMKIMRNLYPVEEIGGMLSLPEHFPELSLDEMRRRVLEAKHPDQILDDPELKKRKELLEAEVEKWKNILKEREEPIVYVIVESPVKKLRSTVATVCSKEMRDRIFVIGQRDNGTISYSIRFQDANKHGIHLGKIAEEAGRLFNGRGGGHPPAAGLTIPIEREKEFRKWIKEKLEGFRPSSA